MNRVLILGNGISRLQYSEHIRWWTGCLWVLNYAFAEYGPQADAVLGHPEVMEQAALWKRVHEYNYRVFTEEDYHSDIPKDLRGDSGTLAVAQALLEGKDKIFLSGFDFGGKDVWTLDMEKRSVAHGMRRRWRILLKTFPDAVDKIVFWAPKPGYDNLSAEYRPLYYRAELEYRRLKNEVAFLNAQLGNDIICPEVKPVTEKDRGEDFYDRILKGE